MKTGRYSVSNLLNSTDIEQIIIPEIQRDYVWQELNVKNLLKSIIDKYKEKKELSLQIKNSNGSSIEESISLYLQEEYNRLKYNTRVGFIYAYHSQDNAGKYFLIDGQQRMTTLFLILIRAYKMAGLHEEFKKKYFGGSLRTPKIDYKVRETSHDFLVDFIENEMEKDSVEFSESRKYYEIYRHDETAKNLLNNYLAVSSTLLENGIKKEEYADLKDYIENYVEFNYFDTNVCQQGERLYLYMNSRGEGLSAQERLRPLIVSRSKDKLEVGKSWECWQNFFWGKRGNNPNADKGFKEFCKWASIIHMISDNQTAIKTPDDVAKSGKTTTQNRGEIVEDYITVERDINKASQQDVWIRQFQDQNQSFDYEWLKSIFEAVKKLSSYDTSKYIQQEWLSNIDAAIDYVVLLPCILYLKLFPEASELDVKRVGMFLKNATFYPTVIKSPQTATKNAIEMINAMGQCGEKDVARLSVVNAGYKISKTLYTETDKQKEDCFKQTNRDEWEKEFWDITDNKSLNEFLEGNVTFIFDWKGNADVNEFRLGKERIIEEFVKDDKYKSNDVISKMLGYGDFCLSDNGGSGNLDGNWMRRFYLVKDKEDWAKALNNDKYLSSLVKSYLENQSPSNTGKLYKYFVEPGNNEALDYMNNKLFLRTNVNNYERVVMLKNALASRTASRDCMPYWFCQLSNITLYENENNICYLNFDLKDDGTITQIDDFDHYFMDFVYIWDVDNMKAHWKVSMAHRSQNSSHQLTKDTENMMKSHLVNDPTQWTPNSQGRYETDLKFDETTLAVKDRISKLMDQINALFVKPIF